MPGCARASEQSKRPADPTDYGSAVITACPFVPSNLPCALLPSPPCPPPRTARGSHARSGMITRANKRTNERNSRVARGVATAHCHGKCKMQPKQTQSIDDMAAELADMALVGRVGPAPPMGTGTRRHAQGESRGRGATTVGACRIEPCSHGRPSTHSGAARSRIGARRGGRGGAASLTAIATAHCNYVSRPLCAPRPPIRWVNGYGWADCGRP